MAYIPVNMESAKNSGSTFFVELYVLDLKTGVSYIAACDQDIYFNDILFVAVPFSRGDIARSIDSVVNECEVKLGDINDDRLAMIMNGIDFRGCGCTIYRIVYPDSLSDSSMCQCVFNGYIDSPSYSEGVLTCVVKDYFPSLNAPVRSYRLPCNSVFGDETCGVSRDRRNETIQEVNGNTLVLTGVYPDNYWKNGTINVNGETRIITSSSANIVRVHITFVQTGITGVSATIERGCDKTQTNCAIYGNLHRYSGFPAIPFESMYR